MKDMKALFRVRIVAMIAAGIVAPVLAEDVPLEGLYKMLAEKNNYPVVQGLRGARADVKCNILDQVVAAFPEAAGQPITVKFTWSRPSDDAWPEKRFTVSGIPEGLTDLAQRAEKIFQEPKDFVIVDPVYWTIAQTEAQAVEQDGAITVSGHGQQIQDLEVEIDGATYKVQKVVMEVGGSKISFEMTSEDLGGRWGVKSLVLTNPQATRLINYEYTKVDDFWLPSKISFEYKGTEEPTFIYEFSNWRVEKAQTDKGGAAS
ncbi:MAG: hypothetical protein ACE5HU_00805 [Acidobacteriota bacterium]